MLMNLSYLVAKCVVPYPQLEIHVKRIFAGMVPGWPLFWKTWKSQGIEKWSGKIGKIREKSGKMNYYVAARRHIFVCFMAKSAFWRGFSALAPYTGVGPI